MDHLPGLQIREMLQAITTTQFGIQLNCMNCKIIYKNDCAIQPKVNLLLYCRLLKKCAIYLLKQIPKTKTHTACMLDFLIFLIILALYFGSNNRTRCVENN